MNTILAWQRPFSADLESAIERLGWVLVHSLWQFAVVALLTFFVLRALQRSSAAMLYGFLVAVMGIMVTISIATWMVLPGDFQIDSSNQQSSISQVETNAQPNIELNFPVAMRDSGIGNDRFNSLPDSDLAVSRREIEPALPVSTEHTTGSTDVTWMMRVQSVVQPWLIWIVMSWVIGVVLCSLRPMLGWRMLRLLRRDGVTTVSEDVQATVLRLSNQLGLNHVVHVMQSTLIKVPVVVGYLRPVILLPVSLLTNMPPAQLEAILAHELAHVRRHDFVINLSQTMIETLFFYHPAVWWLSNRIRVEREHCCDDMVVTCIGNNVEYGRALLAIAEYNGRYSVLALGVADGSLLSRVRRIVGVSSDGTPQRWIDRWPAVLSVFALIGVAIGLLIWSGMKPGIESPEPVTEAGMKYKSEPSEIMFPTLKLLNFDGTPAQSVPVMLASTGYPREANSFGPKFTDSEGTVLLEKVPSGTHWLIAGGDSSVSAAFEVTLPTRDAVIERRLRKSSEVASNDVSVVAHVEGEFPEEVIFIEVTNRASEPITSSSLMDISFTTEPGLYRAFFPPRRDNEESTGQLTFESITLSIEWSKLVREGLWKHRADEEIDEPWSSVSDPGKIQVRVNFGGRGTLPVFLTSPETIIDQIPPVVPPGMSAVEARILKQLDEKVNFVHNIIDWRELLQKIEDQGRFKIWVDSNAISDLKLDVNKTIEIEAVDVPLTKVIEDICEKVGGASLGFVVEDRVLKITDAETARKANEKQKAALANNQEKNGRNEDRPTDIHAEPRQAINNGTLDEKSKSDPLHRKSMEDLQKTIEFRLDTAFDKDIDFVPLGTVLEEIAKRLGAKLNIDLVEIWADGGSDDVLSTSVTLADAYERVKQMEGHEHLADWALAMLARGDGTISLRETLSAILDPLAMEFHVIGDTLQVSSREQIELMRKTKSIAEKNFDSADDRGLRTRVVSPWRSHLWNPMALKIELHNFSNAVQHFYRDSRMPDEVIKVIGPDGKPARFRSQTIILTGGVTSIKPGETVTLVEIDDLSKFFELTQVGRYSVQYTGQGGAGRPVRSDPAVCSLRGSLPISFDLEDVPAELEYVHVKAVIREFNTLPEKRMIDVDFRMAPLHIALEKICNAAFLPLELDVEGLKTVGLTKNPPVTIAAQDQPLQEALTLVLTPFEKLSFTIDKNRVFVSSRERVAAREKERDTAMAEGPVSNGDQETPKDGDAEQNSKDPETDSILGRIVSLDAKGISLREAFILLARAAQVPLELDEPELIIAKFDLNAPVTIKIVDEQLWTAITQLIELNDEIDLQQIIASRPGSRKLFLTTLNGYTKHNISNRPEWMKLPNPTGLHPTIDDDGQVVSVTATSLADDLLKRLTTLRKLRELDISGETQLTADALVHFAEFPVLERLSISGSAQLAAGVADDIVKQIIRVKSLRTLTLSETGVTDAGIRTLKDSPLTSLNLYQEGRVTDEALAVIVTMNRLKQLSLTSYVGTEKLGWMRFSPAGMNQLSTMKNLQSLTIPGQPASVDLTGFSKLTSLDMGGEFIDDAAAERISELRGLRNLTLADTQMTETGWKKIATLKGLQRISVSRSRISDEVLAEFQGMTKLNSLELRAYGFSDIGIGHLAKVKSLNRLDLWGSNFTVKGLQQLKDLPNLRTLWLSGFREQRSDLGLKDLKQLRELIFFMSNINQEEFTELEKALPKTRISSSTGGGSLRSIRNPNGF